jgi:hypothetical protein
VAHFAPALRGWILRNPSIYLEPYRIKADPLFSSSRQSANSSPVSEQDYIAYIDTGLSQVSGYSVGLQTADLTKMMAVPWQADFFCVVLGHIVTKAQEMVVVVNNEVKAAGASSDAYAAYFPGTRLISARRVDPHLDLQDIEQN